MRMMPWPVHLISSVKNSVYFRIISRFGFNYDSVLLNNSFMKTFL